MQKTENVPKCEHGGFSQSRSQIRVWYRTSIILGGRPITPVFIHQDSRSGYFSKLLHNSTPTSYIRHFYFNRIVRLWNSLPFIDFHLPFYVIKAKLYDYFWNHFVIHFDANDVHLYHIVCPCNHCSHIGYKTLFN